MCCAQVAVGFLPRVSKGACVVALDDRHLFSVCDVDERRWQVSLAILQFRFGANKGHLQLVTFKDLRVAKAADRPGLT